MRKAVLLTLFFAQSAFAAPGWFTRTCELLMLTRATNAPPSLTKVEAELQDELYRANRSNEHKLRVMTAPLDFLEGTHFGVEILAQLAATYNLVRPIDMRLFTHPAASSADWLDSSMDLAKRPSLVMLYENVPVKYNGKEVTIEHAMQEGFASILERNPGMKATLRLGRASELQDLLFKREYQGYRVAWVEGDIDNRKLKRIMLLTISTAYSQLSGDSRYAVKIPDPPPTRH